MSSYVFTWMIQKYIKAKKVFSNVDLEGVIYMRQHKSFIVLEQEIENL